MKIRCFKSKKLILTQDKTITYSKQKKSPLTCLIQKYSLKRGLRQSVLKDPTKQKASSINQKGETQVLSQRCRFLTTSLLKRKRTPKSFQMRRCIPQLTNSMETILCKFRGRLNLLRLREMPTRNTSLTTKSLLKSTLRISQRNTKGFTILPIKLQELLHRRGLLD